MKTVLLTAVGSASAASLIPAYRRRGYRVAGCDIYPQSWNVSCMALDSFHQAVPATAGEKYLSWLFSIVQEEKADYLIPLTDVEVDILCAHKTDFLPCIVCTPDEETVRLCRNKSRMASLLKEKRICQTIPEFDPYQTTPKAGDYPLMLKPVSGRSSQGQIIARNEADYRAALLQRNDYIAQPYLSGDVYTAEVARDAFGHSWAAVRRELLRTGNGLGTTVRIQPAHPLEEICKQIAEAANIVGVVNMEFIGHEDGDYFLEVNPRFSGGVGFLIACGADYAMAELICHEGKNLLNAVKLKECIVTREIHMTVTEG